MTHSESIKDLINDFIIDQIAQTQTNEAALLAYKIREAIRAYKLDDPDGENHNAFSVDAQYEDGEFTAQCSFSENFHMTIMYYTDSDNETVESLYNETNEAELIRLAGLMLSEGWVEGFDNR